MVVASPGQEGLIEERTKAMFSIDQFSLLSTQQQPPAQLRRDKAPPFPRDTDSQNRPSMARVLPGILQLHGLPTGNFPSHIGSREETSPYVAALERGRSQGFAHRTYYYHLTLS
jgi:hypothetical protein